MSSSSSSDENANNVTLADLEYEIETMRTQITNIKLNYSTLKKRMYELTVENDNLYEYINNIEIQMISLDQYSRRSNVEIKNIPEKINQLNLEKYVLNVMAAININLVSYDLVAVHRIGKYIPGRIRNVIVRFIKRKNAYRCLKNSKDLVKSDNSEFKKIFFIENLCPANKKVFNYLYKLKKTDKIKSVWTYNGEVFYKTSDSEDELAVKAKFIDDIEFYDESEFDHGD